MKKLLFLLSVFCSLQTNAQPYSISFSGSGLSTVKVQNLTTGVIVDVPAGDVLHLSTTTGVPEVNNMKFSGLKVYPNPMTDKSSLEILPPLAGDAIISVCDMTGKVLTQYKGYVENYTQEFNLSGIKKGLHIITVQGNGYQLSEKLLSNGKSTGTANIVKISNNIQSVGEKESIMNSKGVQGNVNMTYTSGERLKYTAVSGNNSTVMTDIPTSDKTVTFTFTECKDGDNNYYPVVQINTQLWMAEDLKTTKYRNGDLIGTTTPSTLDLSGESTPKYQWAYDGNESNVATYGRLYTWFTTYCCNVCPTGFHVPLEEEWNTLTTFLGGESVAGGKLKETGTTHWSSPNTGATNETGFTALPGGIRDYRGTFFNIGYIGAWWTSNESLPTNAYNQTMYYSSSKVFRGNGSKGYGHFVRCLKDYIN